MQVILNFFNKLPMQLGIICIYIYRFILRPFFPSACRFYPTCSEYTLQAIKKYGLFKGSYKGIQRILKCHGGNPNGYDPLK